MLGTTADWDEYEVEVYYSGLDARDAERAAFPVRPDAYASTRNMPASFKMWLNIQEHRHTGLWFDNIRDVIHNLEYKHHIMRYDSYLWVDVNDLPF